MVLKIFTKYDPNFEITSNISAGKDNKYGGSSSNNDEELVTGSESSEMMGCNKE